MAYLCRRAPRSYLRIRGFTRCSVILAGELEGHGTLAESIIRIISRRSQRESHGSDARRGNVLPQYEVKLQRKDGSSFDAEISARAVTVKGEPGVQVWLRDVSKSKAIGGSPATFG